MTLGAWCPPAGLSHRLERLLAAFGALIRSGEYGFRGIRAPMWAIVRFVGQVTRGAASESTLRRQLREAVAGGWVTVGHYGGGEPRELHNAAGDPYWVRDQVPVITFEPQLWRLFQRPAGAAVVAVAPTSDYGCQNGGVTIPDIKPAIRQAFQRAPGRDRSVVEQLEQLEAVPVAVSAPGALDCGGPVPSAGPSLEPPATRSPSPRGRKSKPRAMPSEVLAARPYVRRQAARALLEVLARVAEKHGRAGRAAVARAALELADPCATASSLVNWDYWLARWGDMSGAERRRVLRSEVLPGLLARSGPVLVGLPAPAVAVSEPGAALLSSRLEQGQGEGAGAGGLDLAMVEAARAGSTFARRWLEDRGRSW